MSPQVQITPKPQAELGALYLGGEPHVVHCHYYNHFLQTAVEDAEAFYPVEEVLVWTAQEIAHNLFSHIFQEEKVIAPEDRKSVVEAIFTQCGYGKVSLSSITEKGGEIGTPYEHYAYTYEATFPRRLKGKRGVSYFAQGYLAGAIEAVYDLPLGSIHSEQIACLTQGDSEVRWRFWRGEKPLPLSPSIGAGAVQPGELPHPPGSSFPASQIRDGFLKLPLSADPETGLIEAFGVVLTLIPANYYALISERHLRRMEKIAGTEVRPLILDMLIESGHVCAFNTLGGIMQSAEWDAIVRPHLRNPEDWLYGITAIMPALGWGLPSWINPPTAQKAELRLTNWYESTALAALPDGERTLDHSPFARGLFSGIMALLYEARLNERRLSFDGHLYRQLFQEGRVYEGEFTKSRLLGAPYDEVVVSRTR
ncbi:MAG: hypothetical protein RMJ57_08720 [Bacteroidia bacterium]|nr:hypothetical protein [Bacteroidia bacterium]